jgi:molybdopterin-guanine dinucleotide biosynthesis protein A
MGRDKARLEVGGRPLAVIAADALRAAGAQQVLAVGGDGPALAALGLDPVPDDHPGEGPLGGVVAALAASPLDVVMVLACDLPDASSDSITAVLAARGDADVAVPRRGGRLDVLHAAYHRRVLPHLRERFAAGERAVHRALAGLRVEVVEGLDPRTLTDVDEPPDLRGQIGPVP